MVEHLVGRGKIGFVEHVNHLVLIHHFSSCHDVGSRCQLALHQPFYGLWLYPVIGIKVEYKFPIRLRHQGVSCRRDSPVMVVVQEFGLRLPVGIPLQHLSDHLHAVVRSPIVDEDTLQVGVSLPEHRLGATPYIFLGTIHGHANGDKTR